MEELLVSVGLEAGEAGPPVGRLRLRLGEESLAEHLPTEPVWPTLLQACRALLALASGARDRVTITLAGGSALCLDARGDRLIARLTTADGLVLLHDHPVSAQALIRSVAEASRASLSTASGPDAPLAGSLAQAAAALADLPPELPEAAPRAGAPAGSGRPASRPVRLELSAGGRLVVSLGPQRVDVEDTDAQTVGQALVEAVDALLQTRDWPPGVQSVALDPRGGRRLVLRRTDDGLLASVVDAAQHELCAPWPLDVGELARAALRCLQGLPAEVDGWRRALLRLIRWEQALRRPAQPGGRPPRGWRPIGPPAPAPDGEALPVARLRHLAWRRVWRREAPG